MGKIGKIGGFLAQIGANSATESAIQTATPMRCHPDPERNEGEGSALKIAARVAPASQPAVSWASLPALTLHRDFHDLGRRKAPCLTALSFYALDTDRNFLIADQPGAIPNSPPFVVPQTRCHPERSAAQ
jgi:hypothetical protein